MNNCVSAGLVLHWIFKSDDAYNEQTGTCPLIGPYYPRLVLALVLDQYSKTYFSAIGGTLNCDCLLDWSVFLAF